MQRIGVTYSRRSSCCWGDNRELVMRVESTPGIRRCDEMVREMTGSRTPYCLGFCLEPNLIVLVLSAVTWLSSKAGQHESHHHDERGSVAVQLHINMNEVVRVFALRLLLRETHGFESFRLRGLKHDRIATQSFLSLALEIEDRRVFFTGNITPVQGYVQAFSSLFAGVLGYLDTNFL